MAKKAIEQTISNEGQILIGWRDVPTDEIVLGETVKDNAPQIKQFFIQKGIKCKDEKHFQRKLYVINGSSRVVYRFEDDKSQFVREFNAQDELTKASIEKNIESKKSALDQNFSILNKRLSQVEDFLSGEADSKESTPIKPLSSNLVRSIQELLCS